MLAYVLGGHSPRMPNRRNGLDRSRQGLLVRRPNSPTTFSPVGPWTRAPDPVCACS